MLRLGSAQPFQYKDWVCVKRRYSCVGNKGRAVRLGKGRASERSARGFCRGEAFRFRWAMPGCNSCCALSFSGFVRLLPICVPRMEDVLLALGKNFGQQAFDVGKRLNGRRTNGDTPGGVYGVDTPKCLAYHSFARGREGRSLGEQLENAYAFKQRKMGVCPSG